LLVVAMKLNTPDYLDHKQGKIHVCS
jgi:hypothetical protein